MLFLSQTFTLFDFFCLPLPSTHAFPFHHRVVPALGVKQICIIWMPCLQCLWAAWTILPWVLLCSYSRWCCGWWLSAALWLKLWLIRFLSPGIIVQLYSACHLHSDPSERDGFKRREVHGYINVVQGWGEEGRMGGRVYWSEEREVHGVSKV